MDEDRPGDEQRWLPPDPGGRPPDVEPPSERPTQPLPREEAPEQGQPQPQPPTHQPPPGWQPPPPGWYPPPQPPPGYWWPQQQPPWTQTGDPNDPGNGNAIAGFVLGLSGLGLLVLLFGISAPLTVILGGLAIWFGVKGKRAVDDGTTAKHRGLAQAGFVIGIATVVLSILAIVGWTLLLTLDDDFLDELDDPNNDFDNFDSVRAAITAVIPGR